MDSPILEYRYAELRTEGARSVSGTVIRFGNDADIGGAFRERISRHALRPDDTILNLQHDRRKPLARLGGSLRFVQGNDALELRAEIVETATGDEALALIKAGIIRGISVEMQVRNDTWAHGEIPLRTVHDAIMSGVSLVDKPAYPKSSIQRCKDATGLVEVMPYKWHTYI